MLVCREQLGTSDASDACVRDERCPRPCVYARPCADPVPRRIGVPLGDELRMFVRGLENACRFVSRGDARDTRAGRFRKDTSCVRTPCDAQRWTALVLVKFTSMHHAPPGVRFHRSRWVFRSSWSASQKLKIDRQKHSSNDKALGSTACTLGPPDTPLRTLFVVMSSHLDPPALQMFPEDPHAKPTRVVLLPLDSATTPTSTALLKYYAKHVYKPGDNLLLLRVVPPMRWRADEDAPGAGLANALAAGVSVVTLNQFADSSKYDEDKLANFLDDDLELLKASLLNDAIPILNAAGVPEQSIAADVTASTMSLTSIGDVICDVAKNMNVELVVMAKRGRGAWSEAILGSATQRVVHKCKCPTLVWNTCPTLTQKEMGDDLSEVDDPALI